MKVIIDIDRKIKPMYTVNTLYEASQVVRQYIELQGYGASVCGGGIVVKDSNTSEQVARISYNGCIWDNDGFEMYNEYPLEKRAKLIKFRAECGDLKLDNPYLTEVERISVVD